MHPYLPLGSVQRTLHIGSVVLGNKSGQVTVADSSSTHRVALNGSHTLTRLIFTYSSLSGRMGMRQDSLVLPL
jgi:hypothetical protein